MATSTVKKTRRRPEPTWEIARLFPLQGDWSEEEYLALDTNHLVELTDGFLEFLPMPTTIHQRIVFWMANLLNAFAIKGSLGEVLIAGLPVRLRSGKYREPDILFMLTANFARIGEQYWDGADLVMEVVSPDGRKRDLVEKRRDYARAGIAEYWIIDPQKKTVQVLRLKKKVYVVHSEGTLKETVESALLPGFNVSVSEVFESAKNK